MNDWNRIMSTIFNGASNIAQAGGLAALSDKGWAEVHELVSFYKENAAILKWVGCRRGRGRMGVGLCVLYW